MIVLASVVAFPFLLFGLKIALTLLLVLYATLLVTLWWWIWPGYAKAERDWSNFFEQNLAIKEAAGKLKPVSVSRSWPCYGSPVRKQVTILGEDGYSLEVTPKDLGRRLLLCKYPKATVTVLRVALYDLAATGPIGSRLANILHHSLVTYPEADQHAIRLEAERLRELILDKKKGVAKKDTEAAQAMIKRFESVLREGLRDAD